MITLSPAGRYSDQPTSAPSTRSSKRLSLGLSSTIRLMPSP
jgi:hypothetical protein